MCQTIYLFLLLLTLTLENDTGEGKISKERSRGRTKYNQMTLACCTKAYALIPTNWKGVEPYYWSLWHCWSCGGVDLPVTSSSVAGDWYNHSPRWTRKLETESNHIHARTIFEQFWFQSRIILIPNNPVPILSCIPYSPPYQPTRSKESAIRRPNQHGKRKGSKLHGPLREIVIFCLASPWYILQLQHIHT